MPLLIPVLTCQPPEIVLYLNCGGFVQIDDWNGKAVRSLLADADRASAPLELENDRAGGEMRDDAIARARRSYLDLVRRCRPLIMSEEDQIAFQKMLDRLTAISRR